MADPTTVVGLVGSRSPVTGSVVFGANFPVFGSGGVSVLNGSPTKTRTDYKNILPTGGGAASRPTTGVLYPLRGQT